MYLCFFRQSGKKAQEFLVFWKRHFCLTFRGFVFREAFAGIAPASKFLPGGPGIVRRPGFAENVGGKGPGFDSRRAPVQRILFDVEDDEAMRARRIKRMKRAMRMRQMQMRMRRNVIMTKEQDEER